MKTLIGTLLAAIVGLTSATAWAYTDTGYFFIGRLEASTSATGSFRVYPASGFSLPKICTYNDFAVANPTDPSGIEIGQMNDLLMSAFLAGRRVTLRLDGCETNDKRPLYRIVTVNMDQ